MESGPNYIGGFGFWPVFFLSGSFGFWPILGDYHTGFWWLWILAKLDLVVIGFGFWPYKLQFLCGCGCGGFGSRPDLILWLLLALDSGHINCSFCVVTTACGFGFRPKQQCDKLSVLRFTNNLLSKFCLIVKKYIHKTTALIHRDNT